MELRKINVKDIRQQWEYTTALPEDENGLTNPFHGVSFEEYKNTVLPKMISYQHPVDMPDWFVPETYFYLWDEGKLVGEFRIRHHLTDVLREGAGHIGYSISKDYRGKGYGTEGLKLTLQKAKFIVPEEEIYLRVNKDNIASQKVMIKNGAYKTGEDEEHFFMRINKDSIKETQIQVVPFTMDYLKDYYEAFDEEITKYQWPDPFETEDDAKELLQSFLDEVESGDTLLYSILSEDGRFLGSSEIHALKEDCPEVGVWIRQSEWNNGYAYKALKAALDRAFEDYGKTLFFYEADVRNIGSMKLLRKFEDEYEIKERPAEKLTTDSGKELELQGFILKRK